MRLPLEPAIFIGDVVHRRVAPRHHALRYRVFSLYAPVDRLDAAFSGLKLAAHNKAGVVSLRHRDYGNGHSPLNDYLRDVSAPLPNADKIAGFTMLAYPRVLGYVFNPLTVYFGLDAAGAPQLVLYEVSNTFGERTTYALPVTQGVQDVVAQTCAKSFYVSPFNDARGQYGFRLKHDSDTGALAVGVALKNDTGPVMNAYFRAQQHPMTDRALVKALAQTGWMTGKVMAGIHWEALRLWLKGLRPEPRTKTPLHQVHYHPQETPPHV